MNFRLTMTVTCLTLVFIFCAEIKGQDKAANSRKIVRIGAVGGANAKTAMANLTTYLSRQGFPVDYLMYSSYSALVDGLARGEVDIAWNAPLAHVQFHLRTGCTSQTLAMRACDVGLHLTLVARADAKIKSPNDLSGQRLLLGREGDQEGLLSVYFLQKAGAKLDQIRVVRLAQKDAQGKRADSWPHILQALSAGQSDAAIIPQDFWNRSAAWQEKNPQVKAVWSSPAFNHCVFTAAKGFDAKLGKQFTRLMTTLDPQDPLVAELNRLEGTSKWLPGDAKGFEALIEALQQQKNK